MPLLWTYKLYVHARAAHDPPSFNILSKQHSAAGSISALFPERRSKLSRIHTLWSILSITLADQLMQHWFRKNLGDPLLAGPVLDHIHALFTIEYERCHQPVDMALFIRHESAEHLHCETVIFFSPTAATVASAVEADTCARPARSDLGLLAGSDKAWSLLFTDD